MTLSGKSEQEPRLTAKKRFGSAVGSSAESDTDVCNFSDVVDKACEGLMDRQIKNSIQRIHKMEVLLSGLEQEIDAFLLMKDGELS